MGTGVGTTTSHTAGGEQSSPDIAHEGAALPSTSVDLTRNLLTDALSSNRGYGVTVREPLLHLALVGLSQKVDPSGELSVQPARDFAAAVLEHPAIKLLADSEREMIAGVIQGSRGVQSVLTALTEGEALGSRRASDRDDPRVTDSLTRFAPSLLNCEFCFQGGWAHVDKPKRDARFIHDYLVDDRLKVAPDNGSGPRAALSSLTLAWDMLTQLKLHNCALSGEAYALVKDPAAVDAEALKAKLSQLSQSKLMPLIQLSLAAEDELAPNLRSVFPTQLEQLQFYSLMALHHKECDTLGIDRSQVQVCALEAAIKGEFSRNRDLFLALKLGAPECFSPHAHSIEPRITAELPKLPREVAVRQALLEVILMNGGLPSLLKKECQLSHQLSEALAPIDYDAKTKEVLIQSLQGIRGGIITPWGLRERSLAAIESSVERANQFLTRAQSPLDEAFSDLFNPKPFAEMLSRYTPSREIQELLAARERKSALSLLRQHDGTIYEVVLDPKQHGKTYFVVEVGPSAYGITRYVASGVGLMDKTGGERAAYRRSRSMVSASSLVELIHAGLAKECPTDSVPKEIADDLKAQ